MEEGVADENSRTSCGRKKSIAAGDPIAVVPLIRIGGRIRLDVELAAVDVPVRDPQTFVRRAVHTTAI